MDERDGKRAKLLAKEIVREQERVKTQRQMIGCVGLLALLACGYIVSQLGGASPLAATRTPRMGVTVHPTVTAVSESAESTAFVTPTIQVMGLSMVVYPDFDTVVLRDCPARTCESLRAARSDEALAVNAAANGEAVEDGNLVWYRVGRGWVYSGVVSERAMTSIDDMASAVDGAAPVSVPVGIPASSPYACNGINDLNCADFSAGGASAQRHLLTCGDEDALDRDGDGLACEWRGG
jgi:hypothetical protein